MARESGSILAHISIAQGCDSTLSGYLTRMLRKKISPQQFSQRCRAFVTHYEKHQPRNYPQALGFLICIDDFDKILPKFYKAAFNRGTDRCIVFFDGSDTKDILAIRGRVGEKEIEDFVFSDRFPEFMA